MQPTKTSTRRSCWHSKADTTSKHEQSVAREMHGHIHDEWCIHPLFFAPIEDWLSHPFNWAQTSPYPILDLPQDVQGK